MYRANVSQKVCQLGKCVRKAVGEKDFLTLDEFKVKFEHGIVEHAGWIVRWTPHYVGSAVRDVLAALQPDIVLTLACIANSHTISVK